MNRRSFISIATASLTTATGAGGQSSVLTRATEPVKAIAFDGFALFDLTFMSKLAIRLFPEQGKELGAIWRTKQFEYAWLLAAGGQYQDFRAVAEAALIYAAKATGVRLTEPTRLQLLEQYESIPVWPDVIPTLKLLKQQGYRLAILSNLTPSMLQNSSRVAGVENYFNLLISTDKARTYKPTPQAYQLGPGSFHLLKEEIIFVASAGWDASGAKWFGYPTFWVNRLGVPPEELMTSPDGVGNSLADLIKFL